MNTSSRRTFGLVLILLGVVAAVLLLFLQGPVVQFAENYLSADHKITAGGKRQLLEVLYFGLFLVVLFGAGLWLSTKQAIFSRLRAAFLHDPLYQKRFGQISPGWVFALTTLVGLAMSINMRLMNVNSDLFRRLYLEDGFFENLTFVLYFVSSILVARSAFLIWKQPQDAAHPRWLAVFYAVVALGLFLMAGEEISWGQRIIGWQTPEVFATGNVQDETNLHNFFNDIFPLLYTFTALIVIPVLLAAYMEFTGRGNAFSRMALPHPSLIGLAVIIAFVEILWGNQEIVEELIALLVFFYSLRVGTMALSRAAQPARAVLRAE